VTELKIQCYNQPDALCMLRAWPLNAENVKRVFDWVDSPQVLNNVNLTCYVAFTPSPDRDAKQVALDCVCVGPAEEDEDVKALFAQLQGTDEVDLIPVGRVPWSVPQTLFDVAMGSAYWYMSQMYYPYDEPISAAALTVAREHYEKLPMHLNTLLLFESRGSRASSQMFAFPVDECAQPHYGQRWECFVFYAAAEERYAHEARDYGRAGKSAISTVGFKAGGRVHLTQDEPSRPDYFYGPNTERVQEVVAKYDPVRLFASANGMQF
jgi:hypothetical protein